jgi:hypothetical protein
MKSCLDFRIFGDTVTQEPGHVDSVFPKHERQKFGGHIWTGPVRLALRMPVLHLPAKPAISL